MTLRFLKAEQEYFKTGNATRSMLAAGYSKTTAAKKTAEFLDRVQVKIDKIVRAIELNEWAVARKYKELLDAKRLIFNPRTGEKFEVENSEVQLRTAQQLQEILEPRPTSVALGSNGDPAKFTNVILVTECPRPDRSKQNTKKVIDA